MQADVAWTSYSFFAGLGSALSPLLSGALFDLRGSYDDVFYVAAAVAVLISLILFVIPFQKCLRKRKIEYDHLN